MKDVDYNRSEILDGIKELDGKDFHDKSTLYGEGDSGKRIAEILASVELKSSKIIQY